MQPYQKASEKMRESGEYPIEALKQLGTTALAGAGAKVGSSILGSILPKVKALISPYVPDNLSIQGLKKLDPRFGKFIDGALQNGYDYGEIRNSIGERIEKSTSTEAKPSNVNLVEQYSPDLHRFILERIQKGDSPLQAGAIASLDSTANKKFKSIIDKIVKDHKAPWSAIVESVYGSNPQTNVQQQPQPQQQQGSDKWTQIASTLQNLLNS